MRKSAILLCILGFSSLIVGSVLAIRPLQESIFKSRAIPTFGRIVDSDNAEPQGASPAATLDKIGYLTVLASIGFFAVALLRNRKST